MARRQPPKDLRLINWYELNGALMDEFDLGELKSLIVKERAGKNRPTLIKRIEARIRKLYGTTALETK